MAVQLPPTKLKEKSVLQLWTFPSSDSTSPAISEETQLHMMCTYQEKHIHTYSQESEALEVAWDTKAMIDTERLFYITCDGKDQGVLLYFYFMA